MNNGIEMILQVNAFTQAIRAYQNTPFALRQLGNAQFTFFRRQQAGNGIHRAARQFPAQFFRHIFGGRDKAAENNGGISIAYQFFYMGNTLFELGILFSHKVFRHAGQFGKRPAPFGSGRVKHGAGFRLTAFRVIGSGQFVRQGAVISAVQVKKRPCSQRIQLFSIVRLAFQAITQSAGTQSGRRGGRAGRYGAKQGQG